MRSAGTAGWLLAVPVPGHYHLGKMQREAGPTCRREPQRWSRVRDRACAHASADGLEQIPSWQQRWMAGRGEGESDSNPRLLAWAWASL